MCKRFGKFLARENAEKSVTLYRGDCKQWSCPECAIKLRSKWRSFLALKIQELGGLWVFMTITAPSYGKAPFSRQLALSDKLFKTQMANLMQFMRDNYGKFEYIRVFEIQKRGAIHAHMLATLNIPDDDYRIIKTGKNKGRGYSVKLKKHAQLLGFGSQFDIQKLEGDSLLVASYMTKYISKESRELESWLPKGTRYIQTSRGIGALNDHDNTSDENWFIVAPSGVSELLRRGYLVSDGNKKDKLIEWKDLSGAKEYEI